MTLRWKEDAVDELHSFEAELQRALEALLKLRAPRAAQRRAVVTRRSETVPRKDFEVPLAASLDGGQASVQEALEAFKRKELSKARERSQVDRDGQVVLARRTELELMGCQELNTCRCG